VRHGRRRGRYFAPSSRTCRVIGVCMQYDDWFLSARERGNPSNYLDARHAAASAWSLGSSVSPLIHGSTYFTALCESIRGLKSGDVLLFSDWRGDPDEHISMDSTVSETLCEAAARGSLSTGWCGVRTGIASRSAPPRIGTWVRRSNVPAVAACSICGFDSGDPTIRSSS
jgi:hypothetical protein